MCVALGHLLGWGIEWTIVSNNIQKDGVMVVTLKVVINCRGGLQKNNAIVFSKCPRNSSSGAEWTRDLTLNFDGR